MQSRPLVIITTRLPPRICGVGTFSWQLERYWPENAADHRFLVIDGAAESKAALNRAGILEFDQDWGELSRALEEAGSSDVLLHYAGRAYQRFGSPVGLVSVLRKWKAKFPDARLAVFFHELPAQFSVTSPHYWLNRRSRGVARNLANLADLIVTNTTEHARVLQDISGRPDIHCLPVPSNIENVGSESVARERGEFVIFGLPFSRWQTLQMFDSPIREWQQRGTLTRLHLIGPADQKFDARSDALIGAYRQPAVVVRHGELPANEISRLLSRAMFGLTTANESTWSKSATFMAYLAHGCAVIAKLKTASAPLSWTILPEQVDTLSSQELHAVGIGGRRWYEQNSDWKSLARKISDLIASLPRRDV